MNDTLPALPRQADTEAQVVAMWLHGRPARTRKLYGDAYRRFAAHVGKPLERVTVGDLQSYADTLADRKPRTQALHVSALKSLLTFAQRVGYLRVNVGAVIHPPKIASDLPARILSEEDVQRMLHLEPGARNRALLDLLYYGGLRVGEVVALRWQDVQAREDGGQVTVTGKGGKTRSVRLYNGAWRRLAALRGDAPAAAPVVASRKGARAVSTVQVHRIVRAAARRAGIEADVSPHWLRHAHASHALDRGAPAHLVRDTLGHANVSTTSAYAHARPDQSSSRYLAS